MNSTLWQLFVSYGLPLLIPVVMGGVFWALLKASTLLDAKAAESKIAAIAGRVTHFADVVVHEVDAVVRPKLLEAAKDGKITLAEAEELKKAALDKLKLLLTEKGLGEIQGVFGILLPQVETYLSGAIEKAVAQKNAAAAGTPY